MAANGVNYSASGAARGAFCPAGSSAPGRCNVTVFMSKNDGKIFPHSQRLCEGQEEYCPGGYSAIEMVDENTFGVLYEWGGGCSLVFATLDARQLGKKTDDEDTFPVTFTASTWEPVCVCGGPDVHPNGSVSYANTCSDPTDTERCDVLPRGAKHLVYGGTTTAASVKCYSATEHPKLAPLGRVP